MDDLKLVTHFETLRQFLLMQDGEFSVSLSQQLFEKVQTTVQYKAIPTIDVVLIWGRTKRLKHNNEIDMSELIKLHWLQTGVVGKDTYKRWKICGFCIHLHCILFTEITYHCLKCSVMRFQHKCTKTFACKAITFPIKLANLNLINL